MKNMINGSYGVFKISEDYRSPYYPVRVLANHHFTVHKTVEEAIDYLVGRFGWDVVYKVEAGK